MSSEPVRENMYRNNEFSFTVCIFTYPSLIQPLYGISQRCMTLY